MAGFNSAPDRQKEEEELIWGRQSQKGETHKLFKDKGKYWFRGLCTSQTSREREREKLEDNAASFGQVMYSLKKLQLPTVQINDPLLAKKVLWLCKCFISASH